MTITVHFACAGCSDAVDVEAEVRCEFVSFSGRSHGFGTTSIVWPRIDEITPEGWVAFDPYTHITYCPRCWTEICRESPVTVKEES